MINTFKEKKYCHDNLVKQKHFKEILFKTNLSKIFGEFYEQLSRSDVINTTIFNYDDIHIFIQPAAK